MKAIFIRKAINLEELKELTKQAKIDPKNTTEYEVVKEIKLNPEEFKDFTDNLLKDQPWISETDGGLNQKGGVKCTRVINELTGLTILSNNEGHTYSRYTAIEE